LTFNGGAQFGFAPAVSFIVNCESREEKDDLWEKLQVGQGRCNFCAPHVSRLVAKSRVQAT
jgi:predicted 3-demethylubiquinone-9 3-methyltransferase (glyoxalase superfamily)